MGTEGSAVLGMYVDGSIVTNGPGGLMLGLVSLELGSMGSRVFRWGSFGQYRDQLRES